MKKILVLLALLAAVAAVVAKRRDTIEADAGRAAAALTGAARQAKNKVRPAADVSIVDETVVDETVVDETLVDETLVDETMATATAPSD